MTVPRLAEKTALVTGATAGQLQEALLGLLHRGRVRHQEPSPHRHRPHLRRDRLPALGQQLADFPPPYVIAVVALEEDGGARLTTNVVNCPAADVRIGLAVRVLFEKAGDVYVPLSEPDPEQQKPTWINAAGDTPGQSGAIVAAMLAVAAGLCRHVLCYRTLWESSYAALVRDGRWEQPPARATGWARMTWTWRCCTTTGVVRSILGMTRYNAPTRSAQATRGTPAMTTVPDADQTAIYCRKSKKGDKQQITVLRQKRLALVDCERLGLNPSPKNIFTDNGASAWQRNRKRPGWDELIAACKRGEIKHIVCYHPDRLMRQPRDLEELLTISDEYGITLYGRLNERNLQDPDDRYALRIEIAHACRSSDDTSRRMKDQKQYGLVISPSRFASTRHHARLLRLQSAAQARCHVRRHTRRCHWN